MGIHRSNLWKYCVKIYTASMSIWRMKIVFLAKQYGCSTASFKIRILKGLYLHNEKVLEAYILLDLYWEYTLLGTYWAPILGEGRKLKGVNWSPKFENFEKKIEKLCWINSAKINYFRVSILNLIRCLKLSFRWIRGAKNKRSIRGAKINDSKFDSKGGEN